MVLRTDRPAALRAAIAVIVLALLFLGLAPFLLGRRTTALEGELEAFAADRHVRDLPSSPARGVDLLQASVEEEETLLRLRSLYQDALEAAAVTRGELAAEIEGQEQRIEALLRTDRALKTSLGILLLLSMGLVLWISLRLRAVALEGARLHDEALGANAARAQLLRGVTHDLRNPIGAADLFRQGLLAGVYGELTEAQEHAIERMGSSLEGALDLLNDLADLSRAGVGELELRCGPVELAPILRSLREEAALVATNAGITLAFPPCESAPVVEADARRVRQILENLVFNAIKYTPPGGSVTIGCARYGGGPHRRGPVAIEVVDSGPGIPSDRLEEVFGECVRQPGSASSPARSGLGLALSRHLARSMGGEVTVRSEAERGSTFTLWLPGSTSAVPPGERAGPVSHLSAGGRGQ
jgi:signal transduction histidine kinase